MAKTQVLNLKGEKVKDINLKDDVWKVEVNEPVMHDGIVLAPASIRESTNSTTTSREVTGVARKHYR